MVFLANLLFLGLKWKRGELFQDILQILPKFAIDIRVLQCNLQGAFQPFHIVPNVVDFPIEYVTVDFI